jgi:hypothetical protein
VARATAAASAMETPAAIPKTMNILIIIDFQFFRIYKGVKEIKTQTASSPRPFVDFKK